MRLRVFLQTLGANETINHCPLHYFESNNVGRRSAWVFRDFSPIFKDFVQIFDMRIFRGAPAPLPATPLLPVLDLDMSFRKV